MAVSQLIPQLRTTNLTESIAFYVEVLGFDLGFTFSDFYAGIEIGEQMIHLKLVDDKDPSIPIVLRDGHFHLYFEIDDARAEAARLKQLDVQFSQELNETAHQSLDFYVQDNQGHTLCFSERLIKD